MSTQRRPVSRDLLATRRVGRAVVLGVLAAQSLPASAGRPLAVDDAGVNASGRGHLESWLTRGPGGVRAWTVGPAFGAADGLELGLLVSRDTNATQTTTAVQAKVLFSPSVEDGCNAGMTLGAARARGVSGSGHYVTGLFTCNALGPGNTHVNLGRTKALGERGAATWGVAYELPLSRLTPHVEWFGVQHTRPTAQIGARTDLASGVQLDGSIGRQGSDTVVTLGLKLSF